MALSQNVYCLSCGQTYISSTTEACSLCGAGGTLIDPERPEALRDLQLRRQQDASRLPQTSGEWFWSIVDTCLIRPFSALSVIGGLVLIGIFVWLLATETGPADEERRNVSGLEAVATFGILIVSAGLIFRGFVLWLTWKQVLVVNERRRAAEQAGTQRDA